MAAPYFKQQLSVRFAARLEQVVTSSVRCSRLIYYEILGNQRNIRIIFYLRGIRATLCFSHNGVTKSAGRERFRKEK
jgi:hypothetical protein